jgi:hypothetical protein
MHRRRVRVAAGIFWFMAVAFGWELAWSLAGIPRFPGPFLGLAVGLIVALDPMRVIWPAAPETAATATEAALTGVKPLAGGRVVAPGEVAPDRTPTGEAPQTLGTDL